MHPALRTTLKALALTALSLALLVGFSWWLLGRGGPRSAPLDDTTWRAAAQASGVTHPRRDMVYSVQAWIRKEHPARTAIRARLGLPDAPAPGIGMDAYFVGCGFTSAICIDEEALNIHYGENGQATHTSFTQF